LKEKEPKNFLIDVDISFKSPEKLLEQILSLSGDFSPSREGEKGGYSLIDPLTGNRLTVDFNDGKPSVKAEPCSIDYPPSQGGEKVRSVERSKEKVSDNENKPLNLISQPMRKSFASKGLLECPYCKEEGRAMFFATEDDLHEHISAKHNVKFAVLPVQTEMEVENIE
jgi:hypothetical protein